MYKFITTAYTRTQNIHQLLDVTKIIIERTRHVTSCALLRLFVWACVLLSLTDRQRTGPVPLSLPMAPNRNSHKYAIPNSTRTSKVLHFCCLLNLDLSCDDDDDGFRIVLTSIIYIHIYYCGSNINKTRKEESTYKTQTHTENTHSTCEI